MARTTTVLVAGIIETDVDIPLDPFIDVANELVTECCDIPSTGYTPTRLELIERWLSAHFYAIRDVRAASEKAGPVAQSNMHKVDLNLAQTPYGQQAMIIDTKGALAILNQNVTEGKRTNVAVTWLGTDPLA